MITVMVILAIAAFICALAAAVNRVPLWVAVVLVCLIELLRSLPTGR